MLALTRLREIGSPAPLVRQVVTEIALKDAPIVAGAVHARAAFLATYDGKHLLAHGALIEERVGIVVGTPQVILATIA